MIQIQLWIQTYILSKWMFKLEFILSIDYTIMIYNGTTVGTEYLKPIIYCI